MHYGAGAVGAALAVPSDHETESGLVHTERQVICPRAATSSLPPPHALGIEIHDAGTRPLACLETAREFGRVRVTAFGRCTRQSGV